MGNTPVLVADAIGDGDVWELRHDGTSSGVHEIKSPAVIGLLPAIFIGEFCEASAVDADHDPCVGEQVVGLLKLFYIFKP